MTVLSAVGGLTPGQSQAGEPGTPKGVPSPSQLHLQRQATDGVPPAKAILDKWKPFVEDELTLGRPSLALRAPLDVGDEDAAGAPGFHIAAPTGWTDDEESDGESDGYRLSNSRYGFRRASQMCVLGYLASAVGQIKDVVGSPLILSTSRILQISWEPTAFPPYHIPATDRGRRGHC